MNKHELTMATVISVVICFTICFMFTQFRGCMESTERVLIKDGYRPVRNDVGTYYLAKPKENK